MIMNILVTVNMERGAIEIHIVRVVTLRYISISKYTKSRARHSYSNIFWKIY
jgi:hypothetical protein